MKSPTDLGEIRFAESDAAFVGFNKSNVTFVGSDKFEHISIGFLTWLERLLAVSANFQRFL